MSTITFDSVLKLNDLTVKRLNVETVQVNIGRLCNLACHHCHVEAGPLRTENMVERTALRVLSLLENSPEVQTVDFTGGAPELNPYFKMMVTKIRNLNKKVIVRCNITVLFEKGQENTAKFFQENEVHVVASLPCYSKDNVEKQRGRGVFDKSVEGLKILNQLGYGKSGTNLILDLVYNPVGVHLPPNQTKLEADYKRELKTLFDIDFNHLFTITNMPIKRFLQDLEKQNKLETYMELLVNSFNPKAADSVMCKKLISISYDGGIFDCDFNQMLEMPIINSKKNIWDIESFDVEFQNAPIAFANHCFACTAGAGSSCGGALN